MIDQITGAAVEVLAAHTDPDRINAAHRPSRGSSTSVIVDRASTMPPEWAEFIECVIDRESGGNPHVVNASGHMGLVQFSKDWQHGAPYKVVERFKRFGMKVTVARALRVDLQRTPINQWHRVYQLTAFIEVLDREGRAFALRHWGHPGSRCNGLAPAGAR